MTNQRQCGVQKLEDWINIYRAEGVHRIWNTCIRDDWIGTLRVRLKCNGEEKINQSYWEAYRNYEFEVN